MGDVGIGQFFQPLVALLHDEDVEVRRAALVAAGKLKSRKFLPLILSGLEDKRVREQALGAALQFGVDAIPMVGSWLGEQSRPPEVRVCLAQICGRIGGDRAVAVLKTKLSDRDQDFRDAALQALVLCSYEARGRDAGDVAAAIRNEVENLTWALASIGDLGEQSSGVLLKSALSHELTKSQNRIMKLLSFICPAESIEQALALLRTESAEKRASALEVLDNLLDKDIKGMVLPVFDDLSAEARLSRLGAGVPRERLDRSARLDEIVARAGGRASPWTQSCALYEIGVLRELGANRSLVEALSHPAPIVRETAAWALDQMNRPLDGELRASARTEPHAAVTRTIEWLDAGPSGRRASRPPPQGPGRSNGQ